MSVVTVDLRDPDQISELVARAVLQPRGSTSWATMSVLSFPHLSLTRTSKNGAQGASSGVYGATKRAVNAISASLRDELEEGTIRVTFEPGEHLPAETLEALSENPKQMLCNPVDVARAVLFAVTQPINVSIADIVVRPPRAMTLLHSEIFPFLFRKIVFPPILRLQF